MAPVSRPIEHVVPISLYKVNEQLHHVLRRYKDSPSDRVRDIFSLQVAALLGRFLIGHSRCIVEAEREWDYITSIPSSRGRSGPHPLEEAIRRVPWLHQQYRRTLAPGAVQLNHLQASDAGYRVTVDVTYDAVLIVDDTFTSGARAQSAASALQLAGAVVVAMVPIGRVINPEFSPEAHALWEKALEAPFDFDTCCLE